MPGLLEQCLECARRRQEASREDKTAATENGQKPVSQKESVLILLIEGFKEAFRSGVSGAQFNVEKFA